MNTPQTVSQSLFRRQDPLAASGRQREILEQDDRLPRFQAMLNGQGLDPIRAESIAVLQVNVGKLCNQTCRHCHVDAGPDRRELMSRETMRACLDAIDRAAIPVLDITGGAPEMNPHFRWLVAEARARGCQVIDRCNLTILMAPGYQDLPEFLAEHRVEVVASLPCYLAENADAQRGNGVFERSIEALRRLNALGYGRTGSGLRLSLVYNPIGPSLPPPQPKLEAKYRSELKARHGIEFTQLFTITNMPISRFLDDLLRSGQYERYMETLVAAFNPATLDGLMCRTTLSVGWDGRLHDCDFNQMLGLGLSIGWPQRIQDFPATMGNQRPIVTGRHCFGCTAGPGSGCQGAIVSEVTTRPAD